MNKRFLVPLTVLALVLSMMLSACGSNNKGSNNSPNNAGNETKAPSETAASNDLQPYELRIVYPAGSAPKDLKLVEAEMNKYLTEKINATVKLEVIDWGSYDDKTNLYKATGEKFDIIMSSAGSYSSDVAKGAYMPLDELIEQYGQDITAVVAEEFLAGTKVKGAIYGIPVNKEFAGSSGFLLNKALVEKYNIDLSTIKEPADLEPYLQVIKENEADILPYFIGSNRFPAKIYLEGGVDPLGGTIGALDRENAELKVINQFESDTYMELAQLAYKWNQAGYINKDAMNLEDFGQMQVGKAFAMMMELKPGKDAEMSQSWGYDVVQAEVKSPFTTTSNMTGVMSSISRTSLDPARAMMFINMLYGDKYLLNLFIYGIEDTHYVKVSDNQIDYLEGKTADSAGYKNEPWMWGDQMSTYMFPNEDPNKWDNFKTFNASAQKSIALGFAFDADSVKNEIAAVTNVLKEFQQAIEYGIVDPVTEIPKFNQALKDAGADKIIAEKQKQLDEWANSK